MKRDIRTMSGSALLDFVQTDIQEMRRAQLDSRSMQVVLTGMEHATRLIRDGQRIRVHGTDGYVEILSSCLVWTRYASPKGQTRLYDGLLRIVAEGPTSGRG